MTPTNPQFKADTKRTKNVADRNTNVSNEMSIAWLLLLSVVVALVVYGATFVYAVQSTDSASGVFGDTFGVATSFFSLLTLFFLIAAVATQRLELRTLRAERNDTNELLELQKNLNKENEKALKRQQFQQSFFALLEIASQEKSRLEAPNDYLTEFSESFRTDSPKSPVAIEVIAFSCQHLLEFTIANTEEYSGERHMELDLIADKGYHLVSAMIALNELVEQQTEETLGTTDYKTLVKSVSDYYINNCIMWYAVNLRSKSIARLCQELGVSGSIIIPKENTIFWRELDKFFEET